MKKNIMIFIALYIASFSYAQSNCNITADSLALDSRAKADMVLSAFDTISGKKILYSLLDKDYYIIVEKDEYYKEYVVSIDSICNIKSMKEIDNNIKIEELKTKRYLSKKNREHLNRLEEDRRMVKEAFDKKKYDTDLKTCVKDATYIGGVPSYFVLKDENNVRYGEYSLSSLVAPCPINPNLWVYLIKNLYENIQ